MNYLASLTPPIKPNCDPDALLPGEQLQPRLLRRRQRRLHRPQPEQLRRSPFPAPPRRASATFCWPTTFRGRATTISGTPYLKDKYQLHYGTVGYRSDQYCNICNGFQYQKQIMTNDAMRTAHITDTTQLYNDIQNGPLAGGVVREAQRMGRWPPGLFEMGPLRRVRDARSWILVKAEPGAVEQHRDLRHRR